MPESSKYKRYGIERVRKGKYIVRIELSNIKYTSEAGVVYNKKTAEYLRDALLLVLRGIYNAKTYASHQTTVRRHLLNKLELIDPKIVLPKSYFVHANHIYRKAHPYEIFSEPLELEPLEEIITEETPTPTQDRLSLLSSPRDSWDEFFDPTSDLNLADLDSTIAEESSIFSPSPTTYIPLFESNNLEDRSAASPSPNLEVLKDLFQSASPTLYTPKDETKPDQLPDHLRTSKRHCLRA